MCNMYDELLFCFIHRIRTTLHTTTVYLYRPKEGVSNKCFGKLKLLLSLSYQPQLTMNPDLIIVAVVLTTALLRVYASTFPFVCLDTGLL